MKRATHTDILRDRAAMLSKARAFFAKRNVIEVDCPALNFSADISTHIDLITALYQEKKICYLQSSPEYGMKRLLSEGIGDIYQLSHVFRDGEYSAKHHPEFTLVEWYRLGFSFEEMIAETAEFIRLFLGEIPVSILSYREAFQRFAGFDYTKMGKKELLAYIQTQPIPPYAHIEQEDTDALLNLILGTLIEPQLGKEELCALAYYPASQAALAKTKRQKDEDVALRFEIYYKGIELCNGYHELVDPIEQRKRFNESNEERVKLGKKSLPLDEKFLKALSQGLPDCCGVAVGFDRLMMLRHNTDQITDVLPLSIF